MVYFGASFGFAVMGRISLLIGRFNDLIEYSANNTDLPRLFSGRYDRVLILAGRKEKKADKAEV
jgi:hypothetical protein